MPALEGLAWQAPCRTPQARPSRTDLRSRSVQGSFHSANWTVILTVSIRPGPPQCVAAKHQIEPLAVRLPAPPQTIRPGPPQCVAAKHQIEPHRLGEIASGGYSQPNMLRFRKVFSKSAELTMGPPFSRRVVCFFSSLGTISFF